MNWKLISKLTEEHKDGRSLLLCNKERFLKLAFFDLGQLVIRELSITPDFSPWKFAEIELPKPQFIITENDLGRKVRAIEYGRMVTGIISSFHQNDEGKNFFTVSGVGGFFLSENGIHGAQEERIKITGWADE